MTTRRWKKAQVVGIASNCCAYPEREKTIQFVVIVGQIIMTRQNNETVRFWDKKHRRACCHLRRTVIVVRMAPHNNLPKAVLDMFGQHHVARIGSISIKAHHNSSEYNESEGQRNHGVCSVGGNHAAEEV